jgi:hypothetical protein
MNTNDALLARPDCERGRLQRKLLLMLRAREEIGMIPTNARFLYYELVQMGFIPKHATTVRRSDQYVTEALTHLRSVGLVPWGWIVDETRHLDTWHYGANCGRSSPRRSSIGRGSGGAGAHFRLCTAT